MELRSMGERYSSAVNTSNLKVTDRPTDTDTIIGAGLGARKLGALLSRLRAEWDGAAKPIYPTQLHINRLALTLPVDKDDKKGERRAKEMVTAWYTASVRDTVSRLKTLPECKKNLAAAAHHVGIKDSWTKAGGVILYWLDPICHYCCGRKWRVASGAVYLSNKTCSHCEGVGTSRIPGYEDGRRLSNYVDYCVGRASQEMDEWVHGRRTKNPRHPRILPTPSPC